MGALVSGVQTCAPPSFPGGYVYVTRQLLGLMNDEAELASVLGHEVGHVAARHSQKRNTRSTIGSIGSVLLGVLTGSSELAQVAGQASQLYTLSYSRRDRKSTRLNSSH